MNYELVRKSAIYVFIVVTVVMTILGVVAIWLPNLGVIISKVFATMLVVGFGCAVVAYTASLLDSKSQKVEELPSFAPPTRRTTKDD